VEVDYSAVALVGLVHVDVVDVAAGEILVN